MLIKTIISKFKTKVKENIELENKDLKIQVAKEMARREQIKGLLNSSAYKDFWETEIYLNLFDLIVNFVVAPPEKNEFYKGAISNSLQKILDFYSALEETTIDKITIQKQLKEYYKKYKGKKTNE